MGLRRGLVGLLEMLILAWCGWASGFRPGSRAGQFAWLVSVLVVLLAALAIRLGRSGYRAGLHLEPASLPWPRPGQGGARRALAGASPWVALAVIVLAWEILGINTGTHEPHLTLSALSLAVRPVRAAALAVWTGVGVYFAIARARGSTNPQQPGRRRPEDTSRAAGASGFALSAGRLGLGRQVVPLLAFLEGRNRAIGVVFWLAIVVCAVAIDLVARRSAGRIARFEELLRFISRPAAARIFLVVAWIFAGWHLFAH